MRTWILGLCAAGLVALAAPAQALTVDDVIGLTRADASDAIIMAKIETDGTVFHLTVQEILDLKEAGVSDDVITYMINTGKVDVEPEALAPEDTTPQEEVQPEQSDYGDAESQYATDLDRSYRGNVTVSFGFYYPHWPGYWYSYYYDPFWWPSLSYYWCYWQPYPYYYAYYDPWYYCNRYNVWYYDSWYNGGIHHHHQYDYIYADNHVRTVKDRNIGNRGPDGGTRVIKGRSADSSPGVRSPGTRTVKPTTPSPGRVIARERGDQASDSRILPPQARRPARVDSQRPERKQVRTQPAPSGRVPEARGRSDRSPRPSREERRAAPPEQRSRKEPEAKEAPPSRSNRSAEQPSRDTGRNQQSYSPPSRSSRSSDSPRQSSGSRGGTRSKKGGS